MEILILLEVLKPWVIGGLIIGFLYATYRLTVARGAVKSSSYKSYVKEVCNGEAGIADAIAYPFWYVWYVIIGDQLIAKKRNAPKATPKFADVPQTLAFELKVLHPEAPKEVLEGAKRLAEELIKRELTPPELPYSVQEYQKRLAQTNAFSPLKILREAISSFISKIPAMYRGTSRLKTSALTAVPFEAIERLAYDLVKGDVFSQSYKSFIARLAELEAKNYPSEEAYRRDVLFNHAYGAFEDVVLPVTLPDAQRFEGTYVIGPQGMGKTTLLSVLLSEDLKKDASVIVMDSKGELLDHLRRYKEFAPGGTLAGKLTLIEPSENLAINPLDLGASAGHNIALLEYIFSALLDTKTTPLQSTLFRSVLLAMRGIPNATFQTFRSFLQDGWKPYEEYIRQLHQDDADFFLKGEFDSKTYKETRDQLLWRIRDLTTRVPLLRDMFRAPKTQIDIGSLMDQGQVIVIDNSKALLSEDGSEFFGRFFIALVLAAAQQRAKLASDRKKPVYFYIDEAHTVIKNDEKIATIIQECRSQKIAMTFAHQKLDQIVSPTVRGALVDCAIRFANPDDDAKALADRFNTSADYLRGLPKGKFALMVRTQTSGAITVTIPNDPVSDWPKMTEAEFQAIREDMKHKYSFTPKQVSKLILPSDPEDDRPKPLRG